MGSVEHAVITAIENLLKTAGYPGIFLAMLIEGSGIPLPSEITMPFAGFLSVSPHTRPATFQIVPVIVVGTAGESIGALIGYFVGERGGRPLIDRFGRFVLIQREDVDRLQGWFARFGPVVVFIARLLPAVRSYVSIGAGVGRMPLYGFIVYSVLGSLIWCTFLALLGRTLGSHWNDISQTTRPYELPILVGLIVVAGAYVVWRHFLHRAKPVQT